MFLLDDENFTTRTELPAKYKNVKKIEKIILGIFFKKSAFYHRVLPIFEK